MTNSDVNSTDFQSRYTATLATAAEVERERLTYLAAVSDPLSQQRMVDLDAPRPGWNCLDVGAGTGTMAQWMAERSSAPDASTPSGEVVALDTNPTLLAVSGPVRLVLGDITTIDLPEWEGHFDLVHARHTLVHLPDRIRALANMVKWTRPGGLVVVTDISTMNPTNPIIAEAVGDIWNRMTAQVGTDPGWARSFPRPLEQLGLVSCGVAVDVPILRGAGPLAAFIRLAYTQLVSDPPAPELTAVLADLELIDWPMTQVISWGQRPCRS